MMKIKDVFQKSLDYMVGIGIPSIPNDWFFIENEYAYIICPALHPIMPGFPALLQDYFVRGIYEVSSVYEGFGFPFLLFELSKREELEINIGVYWRDEGQENKSGDDKVKRDDKAKKLPEKYSDEFEQYLSLLEGWINAGGIPKDDKDIYEFNTVNANDFDVRICIPRYYTKESIGFRHLLEQEETAKVKDVAEILHPEREVYEEGKEKYVISLSDFSYPYDPGKITKQREGSKTAIEKGDILYSAVGEKEDRWFMIDKQSDKPIYAGTHIVVIRPIRIQSEYLFLYLTSDTSKRLENAYSISDSFGIGSPILIEDKIVVLPKYSEKYYASEFEYFSNPRERKYIGIDRKREKEKQKKLEDILDTEIANRIKAHNEEQLRDFLTDDLRELNDCYKNQCWKSCLILAGSILEAVLIDWLSEIDHVDYFNQDYMVFKRGYLQRGDLIDYINAIDRIKKPHWMREANAAHEIRKKRNLVHAKLCMKEDVDISEETCKEVIRYLEMVLRTRGIETVD